MKLATVFLSILVSFFCVESKMIPRSYKRDVIDDAYEESTLRFPVFNFATKPTSEEENYDNVNYMPNKETDSIDPNTKQFLANIKEPCAIVVRSNIHATMQSLLRKYKYDARGALIPSSVKYFMKVPQGYGATMLVPLNDRSISHLGGFVRYYKEVPPIPQAW